jgi:hypothetical protein
MLLIIVFFFFFFSFFPVNNNNSSDKYCSVDYFYFSSPLFGFPFNNFVMFMVDASSHRNNLS